ncbi:phosphoenolpyruvate carboxykinase (ATP) [Campylobacter sputorum subsp. bubulus]|uniref:Phosphoenolpyruvate carboxykinase (ATP) n=1 Tax=Campylobacter sputorum subsp. sputorum TaxID=32024 RepID=A0A381DIT6_9BACT|nr:YigZ family protein [Campylobacter sputorum]ASM35587.1 UPF0029 domain protein [Campylobacter sputorum aubsp. sputorum RM3237]ASM38970.1 UPF0029 domain protein [Campylobacter sputorum bv. paraureolyticus LMG 11764]KAB0582680.1 YigZ family protein [Campylobacter sputorum subsp. sputorum]MDY6120273.1 YigZ family protein [Campylobacter sputorum]QEL05778.1 putative translation regulator, IMPACT family (UPF0029 domain) [Campylobacter sputorum subsp. sputorum]
MQSINEIFTAKQEIKKSTFISYLCPFDEFKTLHEKLKLEHPKAVHIVWAYRHYNEFFQIVENQSDDGEPKGTSGPPSLNALRGANLINCGVFVVRYFGGIKLGTGGLVRAYSTSVNLAINGANLIPFEIKDDCIFFIPFILTRKFEYFFEKENLQITNKTFNQNGCVVECKLTQNAFASLLEFSTNLENQGFNFLALPLFAKDFIRFS